MAGAGLIEGYAIVSEDGMLADAYRVMPSSLLFEADQRFFEQGLDRVDVVVHGRHSQERQARSHLRHRLILTRRIATLAQHPTNPRALLWNPAGASFETALHALGKDRAAVAVIGGAEAFALFLDQMDAFHLTRAPDVRLPGGRPVFPDVPACSPEAVLMAHRMIADPAVVLDTVARLSMVTWRRSR